MVLRNTVINQIPAEEPVKTTNTSPSRTTVNVSVITLTPVHQRHTSRELILNVIKVVEDKVMLGEMPSILTHSIERELLIKVSDILVATQTTVRETLKLVPENTVINQIHVELLVISISTSPSKTTVGANATTVMLVHPMSIRRDLIVNVTKVVKVKEMA
jgi:hypothetical protein